MHEYWDMISSRHRAKLLSVAKKRGVDLDTAMRNIITYLKSDTSNPNRPEYFKEFITARHVEGMIEMIVL